MGERALLAALRLSLTTRWRRMRQQARAHWALSIGGIVASTVAVLALQSAARTPAIRDAVAWTMQNEFLIGLAASLYALLFVTRRRTHLRQERLDSWLLPTPISARAFALTHAMRITLALILHLAGCAVVVLAVGVANAQPASMLWLVLEALTSGFASGATVGAFWRLKQEVRQHEESRFIRKARVTAMTPSLIGLSRWPIAKAIAWHRPENSRVLFILAALSVPMGASALLGLAILAVWTLVSYLLAVVRAVPVVAREASIWLRPTSLPFSALVRSIGRSALIHQAAGTALLGGVFVALGAHLADVLYFSSLWLATAVMIGMTTMRQSYLSLPSFGRTVLSVLVMLITESRVRGVGLPLALVVASFHMRGLRERA